MFDWANELSCAITICDTKGVIIYQNQKSIAAFAGYGTDLTGKNLKDCHKPESWTIIERLIEGGGSNSYTIEKKGVKKLIHQTPWHQNGKIGGMVEFSIELPTEMPHHIRGNF